MSTIEIENADIHDAAATLSARAEALGTRVGAMIDGAGDKLTAARDSAGAALGRSRDAAKAFASTVDGKMRRNPLATLAIGIGVGAVLSRLLFR